MCTEPLLCPCIFIVPGKFLLTVLFPIGCPPLGRCLGCLLWEGGCLMPSVTWFVFQASAINAEALLGSALLCCSALATQPTGIVATLTCCVCILLLNSLFARFFFGVLPPTLSPLPLMPPAFLAPEADLPW